MELTTHPFETLLSVNGAPSAPPPLESEPPHKRLARLSRDHERITEALRELKRDWAAKNIRAQATRQSISTAEITHVENRRRELASQLLKIQTEIGATNKALRERKAGGNGITVSSGESAPPKRIRSKKCPLREHAAFNQYFRLAAENKLESGLYARIEASAKSMLSHALQTGITRRRS
jgi:hypothetical protein